MNPSPTSTGRQEVQPLAVAGRWLLALGLVLAVVTAWHANPRADAQYAVGRADTLMRDKRYSAAMSLLEETLKEYGGPRVRLALSYAYLARRDGIRAERQARLGLAEATRPLRAALLAQLGRVLRFQGRSVEAEVAWIEAEQAALESPSVEGARAARSARWQRAMLRWSDERWDEALPLLEALAQGSDDMYTRGARIKLAVLLAPTAERTSMAYQEQASAQPADPKPWLPDLRVPGLAEELTDEEISSTSGILSRARREAAAAGKRGEPEAAVLTVWGGAYLQMGEASLARAQLERAVALDPGYAPARARLALALFTLGRGNEAEAHLREAVSLDPADPLPRHILARLYTARGHWTQAVAQLRELDRLEPGNIQTHLEWAELHRAQGDYDLAEASYVEAAEIEIAAGTPPSGGDDPDRPKAVLALSRFYTDVRGFGCEKGLPAARQAISLRPADPASFDAVGWSLALCRRYADALPALEEAVRRDPLSTRYRFHLGRAYRELGRAGAAREQYERALDLDPGGPLERLLTAEIVSLPR